MRTAKVLLPAIFLFLSGCATMYVPREEVERMKLEVEMLRKSVARLTEQNRKLEKERDQLYEELKNVSKMFQKALQEERREREDLKAKIEKLQKLLQEAKAKKTTAPKPVKRIYPKGSEKVRLVQEALKKAGYDPGPIDGKFGPLTSRALREFQKDVGLPVTGKIDEKTWELLKEYVEEKGKLK